MQTTYFIHSEGQAAQQVTRDEYFRSERQVAAEVVECAKCHAEVDEAKARVACDGKTFCRPCGDAQVDCRKCGDTTTLADLDPDELCVECEAAHVSCAEDR